MAGSSISSCAVSGGILVVAMVLRVPLQRELLVTEVNGEEFAHPLFLSFASRLSCAVGIIDFTWTKARFQKAAQLAIFGLMDLAASILFSVGIQFVPSSYAALLASANTVFSALATAAFFRRLTRREVIGIIIVLFGIVATFIAAVTEKDEADAVAPAARRLAPSASAALGMVLVVVAHCTWAAELLLCEKRFGNDPDLTPQLVMGVVGFVGVLGYSVVLFPILAHVPPPFHEDVRDMPELLASSERLKRLLLAFFVVLVAVGYLSYAVAKSCSALTLSMLRVAVGPLTWALGVGLAGAGLAAPDKGAGERLSFPASAIEAVGALFCFAGLYAYLTGAAPPEAAAYSTLGGSRTRCSVLEADEVGASTVEELARVDGVVPDPDPRI